MRRVGLGGGVGVWVEGFGHEVRSQNITALSESSDLILDSSFCLLWTKQTEKKRVQMMFLCPLFG